MIRLVGVSKVYASGDRPAVDGLSLDVAEGDIAVLVGPSGCGKTTTLKMINRLIEPSSGTIEVAGRDITSMSPSQLRRSIGYVIQQIGLFPHRTIAENIATVPRLLGWNAGRISRRVDELLEMVDLDLAMRTRYPAELSGGQRQRVGVARALAADPQVMLMDEPFGAVDPIARGRLQDLFLELQQRLRKTIVFVTHDIAEAIRLGDRIAILNVGGILEQYDTPADTLRQPANDFVVDFLGSERGLKRLSLLVIGTVPLEHGPVLAETATVDEARRVMADHGVDWIGVGGDGRLDGWVPAADLDGRHDLSGLSLRRFQSWLTVDASLIDALDVVVTSRTSVAAVFDGDRYLGMLTAEAIARAIVQ
ncbi:MAG: ABC transporter ATP-binding protein [Acidimicrobiia bacterium]|nr:ABC transporter ATP-binding protein [Acidimicrobiia bacterium]